MAAQPQTSAAFTVLRISETVQTVLAALTLAFVFRAFFVEAFIIPTGSMADSLLGAHATIVCASCGWEYDVSLSGVSSRADETFCPNCHLRSEAPPGALRPKNGDRILVHKWIYDLGGLFRPRRWDVIVFRDPADADQNYVKRVVGLPGESVEIIDGDVYIDGRIARKAPAAQAGLWFVVFDQNHLPPAARDPVPFPRWIAEPGGASDGPSADPSDRALNAGGSAAHWTGLDSRVIRYDALDGVERAIRFDRESEREYLYDVYGYNRRSSGESVRDVRIVTELSWREGSGGLRLEIAGGWERTWVDLRADGEARIGIAAADGGATRELARRRVARSLSAGALAIEFGRVDYRLYLKVGGKDVFTSTDAEFPAPDASAARTRRGSPASVRISAWDAVLALRGLRIDRDVYYTSRTGSMQRAGPGDAFELHGDEYFVLGDNSPDSHDSRKWTEHGPHLAADYRPGTVPADQIVGRAAFVYLPGVLPARPAGRWFMPDLGRVRFVR
jgi:signal peptidase I